MYHRSSSYNPGSMTTSPAKPAIRYHTSSSTSSPQTLYRSYVTHETEDGLSQPRTNNNVINNDRTPVKLRPHYSVDRSIKSRRNPSLSCDNNSMSAYSTLPGRSRGSSLTGSPKPRSALRQSATTSYGSMPRQTATTTTMNNVEPSSTSPQVTVPSRRLEAAVSADNVSFTKGYVPCIITMLDGSERTMEVKQSAKGFELFDLVCHTLDLQEREFFGLTYRAGSNTGCWLRMDKRINKYVANTPWRFDFQAKFYPPEPQLCRDELTRYLFCLQIRQDLLCGKLSCSFNVLVLLGGYVVQSELGDHQSTNMGIHYIKDLLLAPIELQTSELLHRIVDLHKELKGQQPHEADHHFLDNAKKLAQYGTHFHKAKDRHHDDLWIGVNHTGVVVHAGKLRINRFFWPKIVKITFLRSHFRLYLRGGENESVSKFVEFRCPNPQLAKRLWRTCAEHHTFFRLRKSEDSGMRRKATVIPSFTTRHFRTNEVNVFDNGIQIDSQQVSTSSPQVQQSSSPPPLTTTTTATTTTASAPTTPFHSSSSNAAGGGGGGGTGLVVSSGIGQPPSPLPPQTILPLIPIPRDRDNPDNTVLLIPRRQTNFQRQSIIRDTATTSFDMRQQGEYINKPGTTLLQYTAPTNISHELHSSQVPHTMTSHHQQQQQQQRSTMPIMRRALITAANTSPFVENGTMSSGQQHPHLRHHYHQLQPQPQQQQQQQQKRQSRIVLPDAQWRVSHVDISPGLVLETSHGLVVGTCLGGYESKIPSYQDAAEGSVGLGCRSTWGVSHSGKYYYEVTLVNGFGPIIVGWSTNQTSLVVGEDPGSFGYGSPYFSKRRSTTMPLNSHAVKVTSGSASIAGDSAESGDVIGCYLDLNRGFVRWSRNGVIIKDDVVIPAVLRREAYFSAATMMQNCSISFNFGDSPFAYDPGAEWLALSRTPRHLLVANKHQGWRMNPHDATEHMEVSADGNALQSKLGSGWQAARANRGVRVRGRYYFEVNVLELENRMEAGVIIGWATENGSLLIGLDQQGYGYGCGPNVKGETYLRSPMMINKAPVAMKIGDIFGSVIDLDTWTIRWSLNGEPMPWNIVIQTHLRQEAFFPFVALHQSTVLVNFGNSPFHFADLSKATAVAQAPEENVMTAIRRDDIEKRVKGGWSYVDPGVLENSLRIRNQRMSQSNEDATLNRQNASSAIYATVNRPHTTTSTAATSNSAAGGHRLLQIPISSARQQQTLPDVNIPTSSSSSPHTHIKTEYTTVHREEPTVETESYVAEDGSLVTRTVKRTRIITKMASNVNCPIGSGTGGELTSTPGEHANVIDNLLNSSWSKDLTTVSRSNAGTTTTVSGLNPSMYTKTSTLKTPLSLSSMSVRGSNTGLNSPLQTSLMSSPILRNRGIPSLETPTVFHRIGTPVPRELTAGGGDCQHGIPTVVTKTAYLCYHPKDNESNEDAVSRITQSFSADAPHHHGEVVEVTMYKLRYPPSSSIGSESCAPTATSSLPRPQESSASALGNDVIQQTNKLIH